jgi:hypothetical protein
VHHIHDALTTVGLTIVENARSNTAGTKATAAGMAAITPPSGDPHRERRNARPAALCADD